MNEDNTSNTSHSNKRSTYLSPLALLIIFCSLLLIGTIWLLHIVATTQDWKAAALILLGCAMCLSSLYMTFKRLRDTDSTQAIIEHKSTGAKQHD